MDQLQRLQAGDLAHLAPELTLVISAIVLTILDLVLPKRTDRNALGWLSLAGIVISAAFVAAQLNSDKPVQLLNQSYRIDDYASLLKLVFLTGTGLITLMSIGTLEKEGVRHGGELIYLLLPATLGAMMMASSGDLITLFVGLELLSITSYVMVGMRKSSVRSGEGAFKYAVLGGVSSAILLYGMSFLYGMTGTTNIGQMSVVLMQNLETYHALIYVSFFLLFAGFAFKIAAAPFHTWAPDAYQGAPTPIAAFLAVVSKAAGFAILFRVIYSVFFGVGDARMPLHTDAFAAIAVLAAAAMIAGNAMALRQKNMKRLLAYSGVANAGYLLVPIANQFMTSPVHFSIFSEFIFYLIAYLFMNIGAFAVLMIVNRASGHDELSGYAGLYYRAPWTAVAMSVIVLSLAGLPVTGGFFGKLFILFGTLQAQTYWLAAIMIVTSVISYYYYFAVIRQMFMRTNFEGSEIKTPVPLGVAVWICTAATVLLGLFPNAVVAYINSIFSLAADFMIRQ